ncbi:hypothetical protein M949_0495 [Riemerella anatipestifer CH3]|nr:hypothetical protein M949_0495 [Riemerella anatipestifer CH3]
MFLLDIQNLRSIFVLYLYLNIIGNVIKKGGGTRPCEALATLSSRKKVLHSTYFGIDN